MTMTITHHCVHRGRQVATLRSRTLPREQRRQPIHECAIYGQCTLVTTEHDKAACDACRFRAISQPDVVPLAEPYRFVTLLNDDYLPGFLALVQSMKENAGIPFRFAVVTISPLSEDSLRSIAATGVECEFFPREKLGEVRFDETLLKQERRAPNINKLLIWRLPYRENCCFVDADIVCLGSLDGIQALAPLSAAIKDFSLDRKPTLSNADDGKPRFEWNSGVMVFRPDAELFERLKHHAETQTSKISLGDQTLLNDYFSTNDPGVVRHVDANWNMAVSTRKNHPHAFVRNRIRFLHYHAQKPWRDKPPSGLKDLWTLWQGFYQRATSGPVDRPLRCGVQADGLRELVAALPDGPLSGVEIGSWRGESAAIFAESGKFKRIVCVDPWEGIPDVEAAFDAVASRFPIITKRKTISLQAARLTTEPVDFVYIDARHGYQHVKADIEAWLPRVKPGGIIAGHDYEWRHKGVVQAVYETLGIPTHVFRDSSWLVCPSGSEAIDPPRREAAGASAWAPSST